MRTIDSYYDCTGKIGSLYVRPGVPEWPMYSFDRPAMIVWNTIASRLHAAGWSEDRIKDWLQSKDARWALDGALGDALAAVSAAYAKTLTSAP